MASKSKAGMRARQIIDKGRMPEHGPGEEWFVQFKPRGIIFAAVIEEVTLKTYVLRRLPDGQQLHPQEWMLMRVLHKDVKLIEPILPPHGEL